MAVVIAKTATALANSLMLRNAAALMLTSTKGLLNQAKFAVTHEEIQEEEHEPEQKPVIAPREEVHKVHMYTTDDTLKVNFENVSKDVQRELLEQLGPFLKERAETEQVPHVSFNYLAEEVYINNLNMTFRKLGYDGTFTRYNHDKGLATFTLSDEEGHIQKYSVFKSGHPNLC